jgi:glycosyltransferase involved in cell wall biosynthesis
VCIPHYNYGHLLPGLLRSLESQTYTDFEVVAVDDGSPDPKSREAFAALGEQYATRGWKFFQRENEGVGNARNFAVSQASGDCLVFMDPDNLATPEMLQVFAESLRHSGADCLTCHLVAFETEDDLAAGRMRYCYLPAGACLEEGFNCNIFGDTNLIIRKEVFEALGGFREVVGVTNEDWEFLARLCLQGYRLEVIPEFLFHYRAHGESRTADTHHYRNTAYVLEAYSESLPDWATRYIRASLGMAERLNNPSVQADTAKLKQTVERLRAEKNRYKSQIKELKQQNERRNPLRRLFRPQKP